MRNITNIHHSWLASLANNISLGIFKYYCNYCRQYNWTFYMSNFLLIIYLQKYVFFFAGLCTVELALEVGRDFAFKAWVASLPACRWWCWRTFLRWYHAADCPPVRSRYFTCEDLEGRKKTLFFVKSNSIYTDNQMFIQKWHYFQRPPARPTDGFVNNILFLQKGKSFELLLNSSCQNWMQGHVWAWNK